MSEKNKIIVPAGIAIGVLVLFAVTLFAFKNQRFSGLEELPIESYRSSPENHLGNSYLLEAQIDSQLSWSEGVGRILSVVPNGYTNRIVVFVSDEISKSLHVGQRYRMSVSIVTDGLIKVDDLEKF